jgi:hypothetical protein
MKNAFLFLNLVTRRFPPLARHAHSLTLYRGKLQLNLVNIAPCWKLCFDVADLEKDPARLVEEIAVLMSKDSPPSVA